MVSGSERFSGSRLRSQRASRSLPVLLDCARFQPPSPRPLKPRKSAEVDSTTRPRLAGRLSGPSATRVAAHLEKAVSGSHQGRTSGRHLSGPLLPLWGTREIRALGRPIGASQTERTRWIGGMWPTNLVALVHPRVATGT